jgi:N-acyl-D-aspartate/D-glutamate deacylase
LFDPTTIRGTATYEDPHLFPEGIRSVIVNGTVAWSDGDTTIRRAGKALRHRESR